MIKVGVTGGIGSGKTTVCRLFETMGAPVYYADPRAKYLMENDPQLKQKILALFGEEAYLDEKLNRKHISSIVFDSPRKLEELNKIVHPAVEADGEAWMQDHNSSAYVIKEAALLIQAGTHKKLDFVVLVTAPEEQRIRRVMSRDKVSREDVIKRMSNQWSQDEMSHFADFSINNDGKTMLIPQVLQLHELFISLSKTQVNERT